MSEEEEEEEEGMVAKRDVFSWNRHLGEKQHQIIGEVKWKGRRKLDTVESDLYISIVPM